MSCSRLRLAQRLDLLEPYFTFIMQDGDMIPGLSSSKWYDPFLSRAIRELRQKTISSPART